MVKINNITLRNVKYFSGREDDCGFNADIYLKSKKVGFACYSADGGETDISFDSPEAQTEFQNTRYAFFSKFPPRNLDGEPCKKILAAELSDFYSTENKSDFKDLCCTSNTQFIMEMLLLANREKQLNRFIKKYPQVTTLGSFGAEAKINGIWRNTGRDWSTPMNNKSDREISAWKSKVLTEVSRSQNKYEYRVVVNGVYDKSDFTITI